MTIDKERELLATQVSLGGGYNRNGGLILAEIDKFHGQVAVDKLIVELCLEKTFGFKLGEKIFV